MGYFVGFLCEIERADSGSGRSRAVWKGGRGRRRLGHSWLERLVVAVAVAVGGVAVAVTVAGAAGA